MKAQEMKRGDRVVIVNHPNPERNGRHGKIRCIWPATLSIPYDTICVTLDGEPSRGIVGQYAPNQVELEG